MAASVPAKAKDNHSIPHFAQVLDQAGVTDDVLQWQYDGSGTDSEPYLVTWIDHDPRDPMGYTAVQRWTLTLINAGASLAVSFVSSAYTGGAKEIQQELGMGEEVFTLGVSLCVLGFALGPLLWAPLSEIYGRQILFTTTYAGLTAFNAGGAGAKNVATLLILRFLAGAFGSSSLTNSGGVIADMFPAKQRGFAIAVFSAAPALGPIFGPIVGGFVGESIGWRWIQGIMAIFTGALWIIGSVCCPETYAPALLRQRAKKLSKITGRVYRSEVDVQQGNTFEETFKIALSRPLTLLLLEPIVLLLSTYHAVIYGTLYLCFGAFPIVYQEGRGWSPGVGGLAFLGVAVGTILAVLTAVWEDRRYARVSDRHDGFAPPETRLPVCMVGAVAIPIGLFWFAWTNYPSINFMVSIIAGAPFGYGLSLFPPPPPTPKMSVCYIWLGIMNYLVDSYTIYAASALAANTVMRSTLGAVFPLFTSQMYAALGIHWASSIPAFLSLACVPLPFLFYRYGPAIRARCKYAAESNDFLEEVQNKASNDVVTECQYVAIVELAKKVSLIASEIEELERLHLGRNCHYKLQRSDCGESMRR
ncbi:hypothetical protein M409DRAFT_67840 [Zasmidium cellare ATCC 36951]|uniref:Major facilitator superfamily (MFS) profile domain-containing protein n=1 Tax=Zasmidium cellare ATCC 36951 TaxID=1080233 RepID=A0A6A6CBW2_ZASCE|nr:uncharacterized protein M409DRAFT_67840 [Zasmidium cellare ATCC 36951]KAF2164273.1 hypothetical protein M409DRAFT_67840 [Zasmidium cellare ATCC 36951]